MFCVTVFQFVLRFTDDFLCYRSDSEDSSEKEEGEVEEDEEDSAMLSSHRLPPTRTVVRANPIVQVSNINPDEIPDVPQNRFLFRGAPLNRDDPKDDGDRRGASRGDDYGSSRREERRSRDPRKKVKGRGAVVSQT